MTTSRRGFVKLGGAFMAASGFGAVGNGATAVGSARLKIGVVSDVHITTPESTSNIRRAFTWFRDRGADGVMIAGDMADYGTVDQLELVAKTWYEVFPDDKAPDGRHVEKLFVYGNHDVEAWCYGYVKKVRPGLDAGSPLTIAHDVAGTWKRVFHEDYSPIWIKDVKGYKFVGCHHPAPGTGGGCYSKTAVDDFLQAHKGELLGARPFFYTQHLHPKATCSAPWTWGQDPGHTTAALAKFPNCVAFSGHSHTPLRDERTIWQGEFTSVGTASLRYLIPFGARENSRVFGAPDSGREQMPALSCQDGQNALFMTVYDDRIVLERRDALNDLPVGADWVIPLLADGVDRTAFPFAKRAPLEPVPQFAPGDAVAVTRGKGKSRFGKDVAQVTVSFPNVAAAGRAGSAARPFDYEVTVEARECDTEKVWMVKRVYSPGFYLGAKKDVPTATCVFSAAELPRGNGREPAARGREFRFAVRPSNCYGALGRPIHSTWMVG